MKATKLLGIIFGIGGIVGALAAVMTAPSSSTTSPTTTIDGRPVQHATGQIKAFGPAKTSASILHKSSHGSMGGLITKSFTADSATQLQDFVVDDRVRFSFTDSDGRLFIEEISKQP